MTRSKRASVSADLLDALLGRLQLTAIRDQLDTLLDEASRRDLSMRETLALLCERTGEALKAVHHWKAYLKLDNSGQWAEIARRQLERLRQAVIR